MQWNQSPRKGCNDCDGFRSGLAALKCLAPVRYGTASTRLRPNCCQDNRRHSSSNNSSCRSNLRCLSRALHCSVPGGHRQLRRPSTLIARNAVAAVDSVPDEDVSKTGSSYGRMICAVINNGVNNAFFQDQTWTFGYHRAAPGGPSRRCASSRSWRKAAC